MSAGSTKNKSGTRGKRLGVKKLGGEPVYPNDILVRQTGLRFHPGRNTFLGKNNNIHSQTEGIVYFERSVRAFKRKKKKYIIHVIPQFLENKSQFGPAPYCYHPELWPERAVNNPEPEEWEIREKPEHHRLRPGRGSNPGIIKMETKERVDISGVEQFLTDPLPVIPMEEAKMKRIKDLYRSVIQEEEDIEIQFDSSTESETQQAQISNQ